MEPEIILSTLKNRIKSATYDQVIFVFDYSGRGMMGRNSPLAVVTSYSPDSQEGKALRKLGLVYDNMGLDYVYYYQEENLPKIRRTKKDS